MNDNGFWKKWPKEKPIEDGEYFIYRKNKKENFTFTSFFKDGSFPNIKYRSFLWYPFPKERKK